MPTYRVHLTKALWTSLEVEADDPEAAVDAVFNSDDMPGGICAQCSGWGRGYSVDEDDWAVAEGLPGMPTGVEEVTS
jgi:hypothetical protein